MSWEQRGNRRYYYRKHRQGNRVVSEYVGAGELAQATAAIDTLEREIHRAQRQRCEEHRALDARLDEAYDLIRALTYAQLLVTGHHTHKGQWRLTRHV